MDQDQPSTDRNYVNALSKFYDFGVEDLLDVFNILCSLLALLEDLGRDRAHQLQEYVREKLLLPLSLLETGLKKEAGGKGVIVKQKDKGMVVKQKDKGVVVKQESSSIIKEGSQYSIIEVGSQSSIVKVESKGGSSIVELSGLRSIVGAGGDSSVIEMVAAHTLPQAPVANNKLKYSTDNEESWPEKDRWTIKEEYEERILDWPRGVCKAGENEERESDVSHKV